MAKKTINLDILPLNTVVEVVKLDLKGEFVGKKEMSFQQWKDFNKQSGFIYRCFQKGYSQFKIK